MDIGVFPNTVEYWGPNGMVFFRNLQVRWMPIQSTKGSVTIALEKPGGSGDQGVYADRIELSNITPRFNFPDLSGNARIVRNWGYLQMAGIVRKIGWVDTSANTVNLGGSAVGWGVDLTSNLNLSKQNVAKLAFSYGDGIENYMNDAPVDIGVQKNPPNSTVPIKGVALPVLGLVAFLDHTWSEHFTSSAGYSFLNIQNSNAQLPTDFHFPATTLPRHRAIFMRLTGLRRDGERFFYPDSHLSESPRGQVPYSCYLLELRRIGSKELPCEP